MAISYTKTNWQDSPSTATPITAAQLNRMEKGIDDCKGQSNANEIAIKANAQAIQTIESGITLGSISVTDLLLLAHPVGSVYITLGSTSPADLFGGTWERTAKGKAIVGVDEDDEDFATAGLTLGEKKHQTTIAEMPEHYHKAEEDKAHEQGAAYARSYGGVNTNAWGSETGGYVYLKYVNTSKVGGNQPHNNIQPSMTFYIWTRTA